MNFSIEKNISPFVKKQFPEFYQEEGSNFVLFMEAYYEWMESQGNPIGEARNLFDYRDIDNTLNEFLSYFQKKYLYGIPFDIIINKRYLLKHIFDVYRSKTNIQCYKLLFRLIYNQDVDIYIPSYDMIKASDGTWNVPKYLELSSNSTFANVISTYIGQTIIGLASNTTAIVESFNREPINKNIISSVVISNIYPKGGSFNKGEKIVLSTQVTNTAAIQTAPTILGSLNDIQILNGGTGFNVGDILKIVHRDPSNNSVVSYGVDGQVRVTALSTKYGSINFNIQTERFGYTSNSLTFTYNSPTDTTGNGASFVVGTLINSQNITYNTDLICDYGNLTIGANAYGFPASPTANGNSTFQSFLTFQNNIFGSLYTLTNIKTGNNYTQAVNNFVRSTQLSNALGGTVSYNTTNNVILGTNTLFTAYLTANNVVALRANSSNSSTEEYHIIQSIANDTYLTLYNKPTLNSTASAIYKTAPTILNSNFAVYSPTTFRIDGSVAGEDELVTGYASTGNSIISKVQIYNSGKGYVDGENVYLYLSNGLTMPVIITGGTGYANNEKLIFIGGGTSSGAAGFISTNSNGTIISASLTYQGSGYFSIPSISVKTTNGSGAYLSTSITEFNTASQVLGSVIKSGVGIKPGNWSTTRGFLNSDKYIQDSYFYQDFSYQVKAALTLDKYKDILYNTFHVAGTELFGTYYDIIQESSLSSVLYENYTTANN